MAALIFGLMAAAGFGYVPTAAAATCACYQTVNGLETCAETTVPDTGDQNIACVSACEPITGGTTTRYELAACPPQQSVPAPVAPPPTSPTRPGITPRLEINIPTIVFTPQSIESGKMTVNWIGEYITGIYRYLLAIAGTVAIVMIMVGGLQYTLSAGGADVGKAKARITNAAIGLVLLFSVYLILTVVYGPRLTVFNPLTLQVIAREDMPPDGEHEVENPDPPTSEQLVRAVDPNILLNCNDCDVSEPVLEKLKLVAAELQASTFKSQLRLTSATRSMEKQLTVYYNNCLTRPNWKCDPSTCLPMDNRTDFLNQARAGNWTLQQFVEEGVKQGNPNGCPHTNYAAVDVWCDRNHSFGNFTFNTACQAELTRLMRKHGFCRLNTEVWHFELDTAKVSKTTCSLSQNEWEYVQPGTSTQHNIQSCYRWSANKGAHNCIMQTP